MDFSICFSLNCILSLCIGPDTEKEIEKKVNILFRADGKTLVRASLQATVFENRISNKR